MFEIGQRVKYSEPQKCDYNTYYIKNRRLVIDVYYYDVVDIKSVQRFSYSVPEYKLKSDVNYYRRKKINKICSKKEM